MLVYTNSSFKPRKKRKPKGEVAKKFKAPAFVPMKEVMAVKTFRADSTSHLPSKIDEYLSSSIPKLAEPLKYEGELAVREAAAQEEIARKAKCVAPAFNKGNYTYIASEDQAKWVGRK